MFDVKKDIAKRQAKEIIRRIKSEETKGRNHGICYTVARMKMTHIEYNGFLSYVEAMIAEKSEKKQDKWFNNYHDPTGSWCYSHTKNSTQYGGFLWDPNKHTGRVRWINKTLKQYIAQL